MGFILKSFANWHNLCTRTTNHELNGPLHASSCPVIKQLAYTLKRVDRRTTPFKIYKRKEKKQRPPACGVYSSSGQINNGILDFSFPCIYSTVISSIVVSLGFLYLLRSKEEHTTLTDDRAMHAPAAHGGNLILSQGNKTPAAIGIAITL